VGIAVYTDHLDAYDWIEPAYFERAAPRVLDLGYDGVSPVSLNTFGRGRASLGGNDERT